MVKQKQTPQGAEVAQGAQTFSFKEVLQDPIKAQQQIIAELAEQLKDRPIDGSLWADLSNIFSVSDDEADEPINYTMFFAGGGICPKGDISAVTGLAKSGKTFFVSVLCASLLGCGSFGVETQNAGAKVLYIDTEQHRRNVAKVQKRVKTLAGVEVGERLKFVTLRELAPRQRRHAIETAIFGYRPDFVVIDGIADLIFDFNDIRQSQEIVTYLSQVASVNDCHILNVLHTSRTSDGGGLAGLKGHLGSILGQKCSDCFEVRRDGEVFTGRLTDSRNGGGKADLIFAVVDGLPVRADEIIEQQRQAREEEKKQKSLEELKRIFGEAQSLKHSELISRICEIRGYDKPKTAGVYLSRTLQKYLIKSETGYMIQ
jgi:hypothetical protein